MIRVAMTRSHAAFLVAAALLVPSSLACAKAGTERTYLQAEDLHNGGAIFSKDEVVDTASFTDALGIDAAQLQAFMTRTPYGRGSFLATYQSHGIRASDAMVHAGSATNVNPLVFLVRAEMEQGLLGEASYPDPPSRVEYAFGCGCDGQGHCDAALAGFDVQVECLARALRKSLDQIAASGATEGGWGPGMTSTTLDGEKVTPHDEATAALYQYTPVVGGVGAGTHGNWLFWNIWQLYAGTLQYTGPVGPAGGAVIGDACKADSACSYPGGLCATNYPGGLCTAACTTDCPTGEGTAPAFCASFQQAGYCLPVCVPTMAGSCRTGYSCKKVQKFGSTTESAFVCVAG